MFRIFFFEFFILTSIITYAQVEPVPDEVKTFILPGHEPLDYKKGDLNGDKKSDAILVLKRIGEDSLYNDNTIDEDTSAIDILRPFIILIRQANGKLKQVLRNDSVIMRRFDGGVFGDPYEGIAIADNGFSIYFYGGSSWRWASNYEFGWKPAKKNWYLIKEYQTAFHMSDPNHPTRDATIGADEFGEISINNFNSEPIYEDSQWKVKVTKTFFYSSPKLGSKPRKAYLIKGDEVSGIRHLKNFIEVSFSDGEGTSTEGYVLKKDLERVY